MESVKQERKDLMKDMPVDKRASGGSFMSKHCCDMSRLRISICRKFIAF